MTRLCAARGVSAPPAIDVCRTIISNEFANIKNTLLRVRIIERMNIKTDI